MGSVVELVLGALAAVAFIAVARVFNRYERVLFGGSLFVAAVLYVALGLGARPASELVFELGGSGLFAALGVLGIVSSMWFLAVGWALHAAWDYILPALGDVSYMPTWYAAVCIGFDVVVAAYWTIRSRGGLMIPAAAGRAPAA